MHEMVIAVCCASVQAPETVKPEGTFRLIYVITIDSNRNKS